MTDSIWLRKRVNMEISETVENPLITENTQLTAHLRAKIRDYRIKERANARAVVRDGLRFGLGEIKSQIKELHELTVKDIKGLVSRIKRRKHATAEDMYRLSHAFLQSNENINSFANVPGALQVIVKELTGLNAERQVSAMECLCNLSLGEVHVCEKITNAAGSYLITYMDSSEDCLKRTSFWTLANIIATSNKATQTLLQMELIRKLWINFTAYNEEYCEDAAICLVLISSKDEEVLKETDRQFLLTNLCTKNPTSEASLYYLRIIFHFGIIDPCRQLNDAQILYLVNYALVHLNSQDLKTKYEIVGIIYAVRVLSNLLAIYNNKVVHILFKQLGTIWQTNLSALFNKLFSFTERNISLLDEILWLLNNVISLENGDCSDGIASESFLQKLRIPSILLS